MSSISDTDSVTEKLKVSAKSSSSYLFSSNQKIDFFSKPPCPVENTNWLSILFFSWVNPLIKTGRKRALEQADLFFPQSFIQAEHVSEKFQNAWDSYAKKTGKKPTLIGTFYRAFGNYHFFVAFLSFLDAMLNVVSSVYLNYFLVWMQDAPADDWVSGVLWGSGLLASVLVLSILHHHVFYHANLFGMVLKNSATSALYRKALQVSIGNGKTSTGKLINLISNDVQKFEDAGRFAQYLYVAPLQTLIVFGYLVYLIGWVSSLAGILVLFSVVPIQMLCSKKLSAYRTIIINHRDDRTKYLSDALNGIQMLKMYGWYHAFRDAIMKIRKQETKSMTKSGLIMAFNDSFFAWSSYLIIFVIIVVRFITGGDRMSANEIFTASALINCIKLTMCLFFPVAVQFAAEASVSAERIEQILNDEVVENHVQNLVDERSAIRLVNASFGWGDVPCLEDLNFSLHKGELCCVLGKVGASKSSLLLCLLSELKKINGSVSVNGKISYASQQAWILPATIRDNIVFGRPYDETHLIRVIRACALDTDLQSFSHGLDTILGERGYNLSGGQRARIALARALYDQSAQVFLLDDVLSALDNKVGTKVFHGIRDLMVGKTCMLVTHQIHFAKYCDKIMVMEKGMHKFFGNYQEFQKLHVANFADREEESKHSNDSAVIDYEECEDDEQGVIAKEDRAIGSVSLRTYLDFFYNCGGYLWIFIAILMLSGQVFSVLSDRWVSKMTSAETSSKRVSSKEMIEYSVITAITLLLCSTRALLFYWSILVGSFKVFTGMVKSVLGAPISFFQTNPSGRILNRMTKDQSFVEETLPWTLFDLVQCCLIALSVVIVTGMVFPYALISIPPMVFLSIIFRNDYVASSREIKRLEAISRSPMFSFLGTTLTGLPMIRSGCKKEEFLDAFYVKLDQNINGNFAFQLVSRWLGIRLDLVCVMLLAASIGVSIGLRSSLDAGQVGLGLTYIFQLINLVQWLVRQISEVENLMTSVERTLAYTKLPKEPTEKDSTKVPETWPESGRIEFYNMSLYYPGQSNPILKSISCEIKPGERVGIVGRTGAGKSTLMTSLFRLFEASSNKSIKIDGICIQDVGLLKLRRSLSMIPQEPFLFRGTLRFNLNPFDEFTDEEIWKTLELVELKAKVQELPSKLDTEIQENGENFSQGERQLFCLVRCLLKKSKILLMDEATSAIDPATTAKIQNCLKVVFKDSTVLTIAHRLQTIMDYDKVLVLDKGNLVEQGHPYELLMKKGVFYDMVAALGKHGKREMEALAKISYENKEN